MKNLFFVVFTLFTFNLYSQSNCFSNEDDVMMYVIGKTFVSQDGKLELYFDYSEAKLKAGSSNYSYLYESFNYLGSGHKGLISMLDLAGEGGIKMYVSCKERMMTDNKGSLLYESGTGGNSSSDYSSSDYSSSAETVKIGNLEVMAKDDLGGMKWKEAQKFIEDLGDGWRLPTIDEWEFLHQNKDRIGGLTVQVYWSSTYVDDSKLSAWTWFWGMRSRQRQEKMVNPYYTCYVVAVREI